MIDRVLAAKLDGFGQNLLPDACRITNLWIKSRYPFNITLRSLKLDIILRKKRGNLHMLRPRTLSTTLLRKQLKQLLLLQCQQLQTDVIQLVPQPLFYLQQLLLALIQLLLWQDTLLRHQLLFQCDALIQVLQSRVLFFFQQWRFLRRLPVALLAALHLIIFILLHIQKLPSQILTLHLKPIEVTLPRLREGIELLLHFT